MTFNFPLLTHDIYLHIDFFSPLGKVMDFPMAVLTFYLWFVMIFMVFHFS